MPSVIDFGNGYDSNAVRVCRLGPFSVGNCYQVVARISVLSVRDMAINTADDPQLQHY